MKNITISNYKHDTFYGPIVSAVHATLRDVDEVAPVEIFSRLGMLSKADCLLWRQGKVPYLERVLRCNLSKATRILRILRMHAHDLNLGKREAEYYTTEGNTGAYLRFTKTLDRKIETAYRTHFHIIGRPEKFREKHSIEVGEDPPNKANSGDGTALSTVFSDVRSSNRS